jgi:hypothetical protein
MSRTALPSWQSAQPSRAAGTLREQVVDRDVLVDDEAGSFPPVQSSKKVRANNRKLLAARTRG